MGLMKVSGCLIIVLFSSYMLLLAERGRKYLLEKPAEENPEIDQSSPNEESRPWFISLGVNLLLLISTFLCYDLVVTNLLVFSLATDGFFLRAPLRVLLCGMVGVLAAAMWYEVSALCGDLQLKWTQS